MIIKKIEKTITESLEKANIEYEQEDILVEPTSSLDKGDYTTNIAMRLASKNKQNPNQLAKEIVENIKYGFEIEKVEVAGPGFINFFLSDRYLLTQIKQILDQGAKQYLQSELKTDKKVLIEYTDANPFKVLHIGHLYTNTVGESFSRLQEIVGANVKRANYQGDIGLHVAKTMWGIEKVLEENTQDFKDIEQLELYQKVKFLGEAYMTGAEYYDDIQDKEAIEKIQDINYYLFQKITPSIPKKDFKALEGSDIEQWYRKGRMWCLDYFETIYKALGTHFDYYFFESDVGEIGYKMVKENIGELFQKDDGAVIYEGDPDKGLHTRVFITQSGLPTYEAKELGLAKAKNEKGKWDESIIITDKSQGPYFKVVSEVISNLMPEYAKAFKHVPHGVVALPGMRKMSSRKGEVVSAEDLINLTQKAVKKLMIESKKGLEEDEMEINSKIIAIAAIKYAFLRVGVGNNLVFDIKKDIQFEGDTGPYLLYVYTRAKSIIEDAEDELNSSVCVGGCLSNTYIKRLVRQVGKVRGIVLNSSVGYSPSSLCTYLFELGQTFNSFYNEVNVLNAPEEERQLLLTIVECSAQIMKEGLHLLGIKTVSSM
jgi:arginyl-tRNA synthetase